MKKEIIFIVGAVIVFSVPFLMILSLKSDVEKLKTGQAALSGVCESQLLWNKTSTEHDIVFDRRLDIIEQKMRKVYNRYESRAEFDDLQLQLEIKKGFRLTQYDRAF